MLSQHLRKFLVAGAVVGNSDKIISHKCDQVCRASELPIYIYHESDHAEEKLCPPQPNIIEKGVRNVRKGIANVFSKVSGAGQECSNMIKEQSTKAGSLVRYMSEECDEKTKMGAVGVGVLAGFLMGMRRGWIRRILYAGTGGYAMSALCYPNQTYDYTRRGLHETRRYIVIFYNFVAGVNVDNKEEVPLFTLPELPATFDEAWQKVSELSKSTSSLITGKKKTDSKSEE